MLFGGDFESRRLQFGIRRKIFLLMDFSTFYLQNVGGFWWGAATRSR